MTELHIGHPTMYRVVCPSCGHIGTGIVLSELLVSCRQCGHSFNSRKNTYRPVTQGMSEEERHERRKAQRRAYNHTYKLSAEQRERKRIRERIYQEEHREQWLARHRRYYAENRDVILAKQKAKRRANPNEERRMSRLRRNERAYAYRVGLYGSNYEWLKRNRAKKRKRAKARYRKGK